MTSNRQSQENKHHVHIQQPQRGIQCNTSEQERTANPKSTGLFAPSTALGGGCFPPPSVKLDPDILES